MAIAWLIVKSNRSMRVVTRTPNLNWDEVAIKLNIKFPDSWGRVVGTLDIELPDAPVQIDLEIDK